MGLNIVKIKDDDNRIANVKTEKFNDFLNNYIDNCTEEEWKEILNDYNVREIENYMGEVRKNLEEAVMGWFENSNEEEQRNLINYFSKYDLKEQEQEEKEI